MVGNTQNERMNRAMESAHYNSEIYYRMKSITEYSCNGCVFFPHYKSLCGVDGVSPKINLDCLGNDTIFINNNRKSYNQYIADRTTIRLKEGWTDD